MKLLWHSNSPLTPTGYGNQTALFAPLLANVTDLTISAYYGLEGSPLVWRGITVMPGMGGDFGNTALIPHARNVFDGERNGVVLTLMDVWVLDATVCAQLNMACWVPIDHDPAPPAVRKFFEVSKAQPIAYSRFGEQQLADFNPLYVPHGVDTTVYKPTDPTEFVNAYEIPDDAFLVGMVAANKGRPSRKAFSECIQAMKPFMDANENVYFYLHTLADLSFAQGEDIPALCMAVGLPMDRVIITSQYHSAFNPWPAPFMAGVYSRMDVLLNPAWGEGFGITQLEAQACGTPVITQDFTACTEVVGAGWHVGGTRVWTGQKSWQRSPNVGEITGALEDAYALPDAKRLALSRKAVAHAGNYHYEKVFQRFWLPALMKLEERFDAEQPITIPARVAA